MGVLPPWPPFSSHIYTPGPPGSPTGPCKAVENRPPHYQPHSLALSLTFSSCLRGVVPFPVSCWAVFFLFYLKAVLDRSAYSCQRHCWSFMYYISINIFNLFFGKGRLTEQAFWDWERPRLTLTAPEQVRQLVWPTCLFLSNLMELCLEPRWYE